MRGADPTPAAAVYAQVVRNAGPLSRIRGFATNVGSYNAFHAAWRENFTAYSDSWDEDHYVRNLAPYLAAQGLPARFIVDQGRVAWPGARKSWTEWCNIVPAGLGMQPTILVNNPYVDSIVWAKAGGESDGPCGAGAPGAGAWFDAYAQMLVENSDSSVKPVSKPVIGHE